MKQSIRVRFTLIFIGLMAVILVGIWCINNWLLENFYITQKVSTLQLAYEQIDAQVIASLEEGKTIGDEFADGEALDSGEQTAAVELLKRLNDKYNIMTVIVDGINDKVIVSSARDAKFMLEKARNYILGRNSHRAELIEEEENYTIQRTFDVRSRTFYLECWGFFSDNNTIFIMSTPLESIKESVNLSNRFLAYVGIAALLFGSIVVFFTTKMVTSPILKLANISERMSSLDFDAKYEGDAHD